MANPNPSSSGNIGWPNNELYYIFHIQALETKLREAESKVEQRDAAALLNDIALQQAHTQIVLMSSTITSQAARIATLEGNRPDTHNPLSGESEKDSKLVKLQFEGLQHELANVVEGVQGVSDKENTTVPIDGRNHNLVNVNDMHEPENGSSHWPMGTNAAVNDGSASNDNYEYQPQDGWDFSF